IGNLANKSSVKAELYGYYCSANVSEERGLMRFSTESEYNINRFSKLLNNVNISKYDIEMQGNKYSISISREESKILKENFEKFDVGSKEEEEKGYVRGAFLGGGSINNPKNKYHIEVKLKNMDMAEKIIDILDKS